MKSRRRTQPYQRDDAAGIFDRGVVAFTSGERLPGFEQAALLECLDDALGNTFPIVGARLDG